MRDLSFGVVNSAFAVFTSEDLSATIYKADLSDQGAPLQFEPSEVGGYLPDLNGLFVTYHKAAPILFSLTLLPYSHSDKALMNFLYGIMGAPNGSADIEQVVVQMSETTKIVYMKGTLLSGIPGVGADAEGRMESHTYRFMFGEMKMQGYNVRRGYGR